MTESIDPVTSALTGHLSFHLLLAAVLTFPIAWAVLALYARAVRRSMRQAHDRSPVVAARVPVPADPADRGPVEGARSTLQDLSDDSATTSAMRLLAQLRGEPRRAAIVYAAAGGVYGLLMAAAQLTADRLDILPLRFLFLAWIFGWPVVLTIGIVSATTRRAKTVVTAAYFIVLITIGGAAKSSSPELTWLQILTAWIMYDLPPTILLLTFLARRIRAVGPLIFTLMLLASIGSEVVTSIVGGQVRYLRALIDVTSSIGLGATGAFVAMLAVGFVLFAALGWVVLLWIGKQYRAKKISDESVTVDAIWVLFTICHAINLVFGHPLWTLAAVAALAAYKTVTRIGFWWLGRGSRELHQRPTLLVLRSFSIGHDSERLFDFVGRHWRRVGSIQMIAGIDLVSRTVEPHEFLDFVSGRLSRRFIDGEAALNRRMSERDILPDRDLRCRVNEFFCYDDTWKMVLTRLVRESDAVVMDLRGFSRQNAGCGFELHELARQVPLEHVVFVVDRRTDERFLAEALDGRRAGVFRLQAMTGSRLRQFLRAMAAAARPTAPETAPL